MPVNPLWSAPHRIVSPNGEVMLNQVDDPFLSSGNKALFLIRPPYSIVPAKLRPVGDSLSQADGQSLQPPFIDGMVATLQIVYWIARRGDVANTDLACDADLEEMDQRLMLHLNALREFSSDPTNLQQLVWTTSGAEERALTDVLLAAWPAPGQIGDDGKGYDVTFALASPLPYAISLDTTTTEISDGGSELVTNGGDAKQSPVMRAHGPSTEFAITNERTAEVFSYDSSRPGAAAIAGGRYAEIDFFKGSVLLDGDPDLSLIAGVDPTFTDFFRLLPGDQTIDAAGADVTVFSNDAFA